MRRAIGCLGVIGCLLLAGGCFDRLELNELAVADMMGIDLTEEGQIRVSLQLVLPAVLSNPGGEGGGGGQEAAFYVVEATGMSLAEAFQRIQAKVSRRLFTSHIRVVVLGNRLARAGIGPVMDGLMRIREMRISMDVVVAEGEASELLRVNSRYSRLPATALVNLIYQRLVPPRTVREVAIAMLLRGQDPFAPFIGLEHRTESFESTDEQGVEFQLLGAALFQGDRLVGFASISQAAGLSWLVGEVPLFAEPVQWPPGSGEEREGSDGGELLSWEAELGNDAPPGSGPDGMGSGLRDPNQIVPIIRHGVVRFRTELREGRVVVGVDVWVNKDILVNQAGLDLTDPLVIPPLEAQLARALEAGIRSMLRLAQEELQVDVFGFGELVHKNHPALWRELREVWHTYFTTLEVEITVDVVIRRTGLNNAPAGFRDEQLRR